MGQQLSRLWLEEADSYVHDLYNLPPQRELRKPHQDPRFYPCVGPQGYPGLRNADVSETADHQHVAYRPVADRWGLDAYAHRPLVLRNVRLQCRQSAWRMTRP